MKLIGQHLLFPEIAGRLEERIPKLFNNAVNFGVEDEDNNLSGFVTADTRQGRLKTHPNDHAFSASQYLFDGFNDLEKIYGLPLRVYQAMNTSEIVALFVGDAVMKKFPDRVQGRMSYNQLIQNQQVEEIVSAMVSVGYSYPAVKRVIGKGFSSHSTQSGDLKRRIAALPEGIRSELLHALIGSRAIPNREDPKKFDYADPNLDGRRLGYDKPASASFYTGYFVRGMEAVCRGFHKK